MSWGADPRIGAALLSAGLGFGGYCLPKDLAAFQHLADRLGYPFAMLGEVARINDEANFAANPYEAAEGASCVVVCTAWDELRELDLDELGKRMAARNLVDGRNLLNGPAAAEAGFTYRAMGRPSSSIGSAP